MVINTDYAFIRLVDKANGKDWCYTGKDFCRQTPATSKVVQVSKATLAMKNDTLKWKYIASPLPWTKFLDENQYASKQCCKNVLCFLTFLANPVSENCAHLGGGATCPDFGQVCAPAEPKSRPIIWKIFSLKNTKNLWKWHEFNDFLGFNAKISNVTLFKGKIS